MTTKQKLKNADANFKKFAKWANESFSENGNYKVLAVQEGGVIHISRYLTRSAWAEKIATVESYPMFDEKFNPNEFYK